MPQRKNGTFIKTSVLVGLVGLAVVPASANAGLLSGLFAPKPKPTPAATVAPKPSPTPAATAAPTPAATVAPTPTPVATTATGAGIATVNTQTTTATSDTTSSAVPSGSCTPLPTAKSFAKVDGDTADYSPAPNGTFEAGSGGWTLTGGAKVATANENLGIAPGKKALQMPLMSTATSPSFCVDESHPYFRFAFKVDNIALAGFVAYVIYRDKGGKITDIELVSSKYLSLSPSMWQATPKSPLATIIPLNSSTKTASVQLKLTSLAPTDILNDMTGQALTPLTNIAGQATGLVGSITGAFGNQLNIGVTVDSVMVDPYRRG